MKNAYAFPLKINTLHHHPDFFSIWGASNQKTKSKEKQINRNILNCTQEGSQFNPIFSTVISKATVLKMWFQINNMQHSLELC